MWPQQLDHVSNPRVGVSRCVFVAFLPSSFLRVGVDLDDDLELEGGGFQVLQGVRTQICSRLKVVVAVLAVETVALLQLFTAAQTDSAGLKARPGAQCADSDRTLRQHNTDSQNKKMEKKTRTFSCLQKVHLCI